MSLSHLSSLCLGFVLINGSIAETNQWKKASGPNGEDIWKSTTTFVTRAVSECGSIKIGETMRMEFDIRFNGRVSNSSSYEQYFRVGSSSFQHPSLWLQPDIDALQVRISCNDCNEKWNIDEPILILGQSHHVIISLNATFLSISVDDDVIVHNRRNSVESQYIGNLAPIWFNSDTELMGDANISNITIISYDFDTIPTKNTKFDMYGLIYAALVSLVLMSILFCCWKSKQIRRQMSKEQHISGLQNRPKQTKQTPRFNKVVSESGTVALHNVTSGGYQWIEDALKIVADTEYEIYLNRFKEQKITDSRVSLLNEKDLITIIPQIGPRREFQQLLKAKFKTNIAYAVTGEGNTTSVEFVE